MKYAAEEWEDKFRKWIKENGVPDTAHDLGHYQRVWLNAKAISREMDAGELLVLVAGAYFHDIVNLPKNDPRRSMASKLSADKTRDILTEMEFPEYLIPNICHSIESHSFSAAIEPITLEAKILQDADRLEALGAIGIARCFAVAGQIGCKLFDNDDPLAEYRPLDERKYALDHIEEKLLKLPDMMHTEAGHEMGQARAAYISAFRTQILREINGKA